jgi:aminopeptidase N
MAMRRWVKWTLAAVALVVVLVGVGLLGLGWYVRSQMLDSGGVLRPALAAVDVRHVALAVTVDPVARRIDGDVLTTVICSAPLDVFELDLDHRLDVTSVDVDGDPSEWRHRGGIIEVPLDTTWSVGDRHEVRVTYGGEPKVALRPPWIDGFVWDETPSGAPWIGVTAQGDGCDIWWPCKDHPSDEPDEGMDIALTVPSDLVGLSNGRKLGEIDNSDGTTTSRWRVSYPINTYLVTVNIAPYVPVEATYHGVDGDRDETLVFWSIPERLEDARRMWPEMPRLAEVLGRRFGEYPFLDDKLWVAHAPYLGMEHQTLVAYGADFTDNDYGFDSLLLHEFAHEWWGNKVTARDWADFWIHEGFAVWAEAAYVLDTIGEERYLDYMADIRAKVGHRKPIVQGHDLTSVAAYTGNIYVKGACVVHTLRWLLGPDDFDRAIRRFLDDDRFAYRQVSSADLATVVAEVSGRSDLGWFWDRYLYRAELPRWSMSRDGSMVNLSWDDPAFELPLPVTVGGEPRRVAMPGGRAEIEVGEGVEVVVDPDGRILAQPAE